MLKSLKERLDRNKDQYEINEKFGDIVQSFTDPENRAVGLKLYNERLEEIFTEADALDKEIMSDQYKHPLQRFLEWLLGRR